MQVAAICGGCFEGVRKRVAEIQNLAESRLALVLLHYASLRANAPGNHEIECSLVATGQSPDILLEIREKPRIVDHSVLDNFVDAGAKFALGQRRERIRIGDHQFGRIERAY